MSLFSFFTYGFFSFQQPIGYRTQGKGAYTMDVTLGYLRESLSNHLENEVCLRICKKMLAKRYANEEEFVKDLDDDEMSYLNQVLEKEIKYAQDEQDQKRAKELNEVYELLL